MWPPRLHVRAKGKTQGGLAEGKVILQFAFKAVVRIVCALLGGLGSININGSYECIRKQVQP